MGIISWIKSIFTKEEEKLEYVCWICEAQYSSPTEFLMHIKECQKRS